MRNGPEAKAKRGNFINKFIFLSMQSKTEPKIWYEKSENLKEQCAVFIENDLLYKSDDEAQLIGQLQEKLEMSRGEIKRILQKL